MSALNFEALLTTRNFENGMQRIRNDIRGTSNLAVQEAARMDSAIKNLSLGIAGYFSANVLKGFVMELINIRGEFQKTEIAFSTMLGDGAKAKQLMGQMVDLAAKTPFSLQDVSSGAKQLLAFQIPAKEVVDTLTRMGNIASGLGVPLSRINLVYGQVKAKGKLMGDDLRQFTEAGIPMVAELAAKFKKSEAEISAMVSAGKIGFKDVKDVLFSLTNEGGMFFNLMEKQSASLSGKISNLEDAWDQMLNKMGEANEGVLNDAIDGLAYLVDNYEEVIKVLKVLIATYGAYRAALILTAIVQKAIAIGQSISTWISLAKSIKSAADAQALFNLTASANPYGVILAALALVISSYVVYGDEIKRAIGLTKEATSEMKFQESIEKQLTDTFSKGVSEKRAQIQNLIAVINSENSKLEDRKKAYEKLIAIDPTFRGALDSQYRATLRLGDAFDQVIKKMQSLASAQAKLAAVKDIVEKNAKDEFNYSLIKTKIDTVTKNFKFKEGSDFYKDVQDAFFDKKITSEQRDQLLKLSKSVREYSDAVKDSREQLKVGNKVQENDLKYYNKKISQIDELEKRGWKMQDGRKYAEKYIEGFKKDREQFKTLVSDYLGLDDTTPEIATGGIKKGTQRWYEEEVKRLQEANKDLVPQSKEWLKNMALIKKYNDLISSKSSSDNKQLAEILPVGSIAELQRRAKLIEDAANVAVNGIVKLRKVDKYGAEKDKKGNVYYTGETVTVEEAKKRVEAINRAIREKQAESQARTFSEEMDEIKRQIGIRDKLLQQGYTKESVDGMFPKIKDKSFIQYLNETDIAVKKLISSGKGDKETADNLVLISKAISEYKGLETYIEGVNNQINVLKTKFSGSELISELDKFKRLDAGDSTEEERSSKNRAIEKAQNEERRSLEASYNQLLNDRKTFEEKKTDIIKKANDLRALAKNDSELKKINESEKEQLSALTVETFRASKDWQIAFSELEFVTRSSLERILQQLIAFRQANKENLSVQDYKIVSDKITEIQNRLNISNPLTSLIQGYRDYRKASEDLKKKQEELNQANLDLAESYQLLNKAQSGEEFNVADQKRVDALKRRKKATEEVQQAEIILSEKQIKLLDSLNYVSKYFNDVRSVISSVKGIFDDLGISMDNAFGDILANLEQTMQGFEQFQQGLTNAFKGFASGNIIQGIAGSIQAIGGLIKSISGWFNNDKKKERQIQSWAREVENLKNVYAELEYTVKKALGENVYKGQLDEIKNLERQKALLSQMAQKEGDKKKKDQGKIDEYNAKMAEIDRTISDIRDNIIKTVLQTDAKEVASQLGDALVEAFSKGEDAAKSLDKAAGDVFRNMVKNALKMRMEKALQPVLDQILKASGFDEKGNGSFKGFTPEQIEQYKKQIAQIGASQEEFLKAYQQLFQDANSNVSGMEGSIKSITSEEAGALIAQINAMRINQGKTINIHQENLELMRGVLMQLMKIEDNTRNLHQMRKDLSELNSKVSKDNGLRPAGL